MSDVKRFYPFAVAEGIIKWLPIDADEAAEMEFVCLPKADYDAATARAERAEAGCAALMDVLKRLLACLDPLDLEEIDEAEALLKHHHPASR